MFLCFILFWSPYVKETSYIGVVFFLTKSQTTYLWIVYSQILQERKWLNSNEKNPRIKIRLTLCQFSNKNWVVWEIQSIRLNRVYCLGLDSRIKLSGSTVWIKSWISYLLVMLLSTHYYTCLLYIFILLYTWVTLEYISHRVVIINRDNICKTLGTRPSVY